MNHIEVEVKVLLGEKAAADALREKLVALPYQARLVATSAQLNHYFMGEDVTKIAEDLGPKFDPEKRRKLEHILAEGRNHSVRTRTYKDGKALLVVKASIDDTTSSNGLSRIEFEETVPGLDIDALDRALLDAGLRYQAKWSREREEYALADGTVVCLDKNAGYGYLAEFERTVHDGAAAETAKANIRALMATLGVAELPQDRLERMFAFYNEHWPEYYGTDRVFVIE
jgi:adenylate cyclase class IV